MRNTKKRDILFLCQFFYPENISSAMLPFDTAVHLASRGRTVDVLCGYPREYAQGAHVPLRETVEGVNIRRLRYMQFSRKSVIGRLINYFSLVLSVLLHIGAFRKYRTVIVYSNPPVLPAAAIAAKKLFGTRIVFVAYDVYPEIAYASDSIHRGSMIEKVMNGINRRLYSCVDAVVALTDEMKEFLLRGRPGLRPEQVYTIPNWAHEQKAPVPKPEDYSRLGLEPGQLVVSYFGNMGTCQDVDTLLKAAELLREDPEVRFLMVGHGNKREAARSFVKEHGLSNVQVLDYLVGEDFQRALSVSSCAVVSLEKGLKGTCAPSKYYSYLQGGIPVIGILEPDSYLAEEIRREKLGCHICNGDGEGLAARLRALSRDREALAAMGERACRLYETAYSQSLAMEKYSRLFSDLLGQPEEP